MVNIITPKLYNATNEFLIITRQDNQASKDNNDKIIYTVKIQNKISNNFQTTRHLLDCL